MSRIEKLSGATKVGLPPRFDLDEVARFRGEVYNVIEQGERKIVIDFSGCNFIDSTGLGILVSIYKKCMEKGIQLSLCSLNDQVLRVFQLTRLDKAFNIYHDFSEAVGR